MSTANLISDLCSFSSSGCQKNALAFQPQITDLHSSVPTRQVRVNAVQAEQPRLFSPRIEKKGGHWVLRTVLFHAYQRGR